MYQFMFHPLDGRERLDLAMTDGRRLAHYQLRGDARRRDRHAARAHGRAAPRQAGRARTASGTEIWLAPEHHFLPVKMVIREDNGTRYEQVATRIEVKGASQ